MWLDPPILVSLMQSPFGHVPNGDLIVSPDAGDAPTPLFQFKNIGNISPFYQLQFYTRHQLSPLFSILSKHIMLRTQKITHFSFYIKYNKSKRKKYNQKLGYVSNNVITILRTEWKLSFEKKRNWSTSSILWY